MPRLLVGNFSHQPSSTAIPCMPEGNGPVGAGDILVDEISQTQPEPVRATINAIAGI